MKINKKLYDNLSQFLIYFVKHLSLTLLFVAYGTGSASARNDLLDNTSLFRIAKWASDFPMYIGSNSTGGYASFSIFQSNYTDSCIGTGPCNAESAKWLMPASELRDVKISFDYEIVFDAQFQVTDSVMVGFSPSVTGSGSSYITASPGSNTATGSRQYTLQDGYLEIILAGYNGQAVGNTELRITNFIADYAPKLQPILYDTGDFTSYDEVQFTLDFDQDISVSGSPRILLDVGGQQKYATLADCYVVQANRFCANYYVIEGDLDSDGIEIISIDLNGGTVVGVNNSLDASLSFSSGEIPVYIDAVAPIANFENFGTIPSQVNSFTNIPIEVSFSENVNSFNSGDVTVTNGSVSNFVGTGSAYSFDVIPSGNGDLVISLSQGFATDALGNAYVSPADLTIGYDGTAPTVRLTSDANSPHSGVFTVTATFSEAVTGFVLGDVTVGNGSASNFQTTSASVYTFDVTPTADGAVTVDVAAEVATDTASNNNTAAEQLSVTTDSTVPAAPTVSVANATTLSGTAEANAAVTIYASNGTTVLATTTADGSGNWSLTNPLSDGQTGSVKATDAAGNTSPATAIAAVDGTAPTVALTTTANSPHSGVFTVTATFSEAVTGFALEDITVGNGTAANLAGSGTTYTFDVTPTTDGAVTVDIAADVAQDAATNGNAAATQLSVTTDGTAPTVALTTTANSPHSGVFTVTATFSEAVTGFVLGDVTVGNGSASNFQTTSASVYTFDVTPTADGAVTVDVAAEVATDTASNNNTAAEQLSVTTDSTVPAAPTVSVANATTLSGTAEANAAVTIYASNGTTVLATTTADGSGNWSLTNPLSDGQTGSVKATDAAGNTSPATAIAAVDGTAPTVALTTTANSPHSGVFTVTATFSEAVTGFALEDITVGNGTAANLAGSGTTYTFDVTPTTDGAVTVDIAADVAQDAATNGNAAATQLSVTTDGTAPTVALTTTANSPHSGVFTVTATFSEAVTGFALEDITVGNGTAANLAGSGTTYTFDVTPTTDGAVTVDIAADVAQDAATNGNAAATQLSVTTDGTAPTVALTTTANSPHSGVFTVTATFSEAVTGFVLGDVTVGNGSASNFQTTSASVYTFDVTPTADGAVTVDVAAEVATDTASNNNTAAEQLSVTTDSTVPAAPTVSVANATTLSGTAEANAAVTIYASNGTTVLATTTADGSGNWSLTNPLSDGQTGSVKATDAAGNTSPATAIAAVDGTAPTVALTTTANSPHSGVFTVTATFSEAVTGFALEDITVGNGTAANLAGSGTTYTFDVTPTTDGAVTVDIAADVAQDAATNGNAAATQLSVTTDGTAPTVALTTTANSPHSGVFTVTATFSEAVTGFALEDITVGNGTAANLAGSGTTYTFDVTPTTDGAVTVDIAADVAQDAATNGNAAATQLSVTTDGTAPTVALTTTANSPHSGVFTVTATFSEAVTGFALEDITVGNGTAANLAGSGTTYTFDVTPTTDGAVTVDIAADVAQDAATNGNAAATQLSVTTDGTAPTVALTTTANSPHSGVFTVTATFSEAVTGFALEDITVGNGTAANLAGSGTTYTFDVTPTTDGAVTVDIAADVAQDAATNGNAAATQLSVTTDGTAPTVEITGPDEIVTAAFDVTIEFSEVVTGLELSEVAVVNGAAIELTGSGTTYVARIDPVMGQTVEVSLAAGVAVDGSGNPNSLSNVYQVLAGSPASEFEKYSEEIRQVLVDEAQRSLRSTISANQNLVRGARQRVMEDQRKAQACLDQAVQGDAVRPLAEDQDCIDIADQSNQVPFDVDGIAQVSGSSMMTSGSFFEQSGDGVETTRRLFFGDFDIQHDGESGSTTATLNARIAWEDMLSNQTMFGYFVGGSLANSNIAGAFDGTNTKVGVDAGVYAVHQLEDALYLDGFATLGIGQNDLEMANDVLALESDYTTKTATIGASLSGVIMENGLELHPELAVSYGKTWLGDVGFTGRAYGLTDDTLSLNAGSVALGNMTLRTELIVPLDGATVADSNTQFSFSPRLICEYVRTTTSSDYCGGGAEIGLSSASDDGWSSANIKLIMDRINGDRRSSVQFGLEHRF